MPVRGQSADFWRSFGWHLLDRRDDGRPVHLGMAQNAEHELKLRSQNILVNLPLVEAA